MHAHAHTQMCMHAVHACTHKLECTHTRMHVILQYMTADPPKIQLTKNAPPGFAQFAPPAPPSKFCHLKHFSPLIFKTVKQVMCKQNISYMKFLIE